MKGYKNLRRNIEKSIKKGTVKKDFPRLFRLASYDNITLYSLLLLLKTYQRKIEKGSLSKEKSDIENDENILSDLGNNNKTSIKVSGNQNNNNPENFNNSKQKKERFSLIGAFLHLWRKSTGFFKLLTVLAFIMGLVTFCHTCDKRLKEKERLKIMAASKRLNKEDLNDISNKFNKNYDRSYLYYTDISISAEKTNSTFTKTMGGYLNYFRNNHNRFSSAIPNSNNRVKFTGSLLANLAFSCDDESIEKIWIRTFANEVKTSKEFPLLPEGQIQKTEEILEILEELDNISKDTGLKLNETNFAPVLENIEGLLKSHSIANYQKEKKNYFHINIISDFLIEKEEISSLETIVDRILSMSDMIVEFNFVVIRKKKYEDDKVKFKVKGDKFLDMMKKNHKLVNCFYTSQLSEEFTGNNPGLEVYLNSINAPTVDLRNDNNYSEHWKIKKGNTLKGQWFEYLCFDNTHENWIFRLRSEGTHDSNNLSPKIIFAQADRKGEEFGDNITASYNKTNCKKLYCEQSLIIKDIQSVGSEEGLILMLYNERFNKKYVIPVTAE